MSSYEHDPLADASYIRANFTYTPRNPKELSINAGDVFHIHDKVSLKNLCVCKLSVTLLVLSLLDM